MPPLGPALPQPYSNNDGFINVYSEPGKGTTLKIHLPAYGRQDVAATAESTMETPTGRGETILLVEDERLILNLGQAMLKQLGYAVLPAGTPGEALRLAEIHATGQ
ncbi:MAG: hypothetical protein V2B19_02075 [Pseudomonadota bacterium]